MEQHWDEVDGKEAITVVNNSLTALKVKKKVGAHGVE